MFDQLSLNFDTKFKIDIFAFRKHEKLMTRQNSKGIQNIKKTRLTEHLVSRGQFHQKLLSLKCAKVFEMRFSRHLPHLF